MKISIILLLFVTIFFNSTAYSQNDPERSKPLAAYKAEDGWHFIDYDGNEILKPMKLIDVGGFSEGLLRVKAVLDGKPAWAFMNLEGKFEIVPDCDELTNFLDGMAMTIKINPEAKEQLFGFINRKGQQVVPMKYQDAIPFSEGLAYVMNLDERGYIDKNGEFVFKLENVVGYPFFEGIAALSDTKFRVGYMNKKGEIIIDLIYDEPANFSEGLVKANRDGYVGFINRLGDTVIPLQYADARNFKDGMAFVGRYGQGQVIYWGLINLADSMIVDYTYDYARDFDEGLAVVKQGMFWYFIDKTGKRVFEKDFSYADSFVDGLAWVNDSKNGKAGYINKQGEFEVVIPKSEKIIDLRLNRQVW